MKTVKMTIKVNEETLMNWVYGGDFKAFSTRKEGGRLVVETEGFEGEPETHYWNLDSEGLIEVTVDKEEYEEVEEEWRFHPYDGVSVVEIMTK